MITNPKMDRRSFVIGSAAVGAGLALGLKIPFGTALGVYGLWIMFSKETEGIFSNSPAV